MNNSIQDNKSYYNEFANWYENQRHQGYHALIDELQTNLIKDDATGVDVLEVGCGTGLILQHVDKIARSAKGIDISPGMLETAKKRGLDVVEGTATSLPFDDESFDLVYSFKVLAHVEAIDEAISEAFRVLKPNGILIFDFYNRHSLRFVAKRLSKPGMISEKTDEGALFTRWDSPTEVVDRFKGKGKILNLYGVRVATPFAGVYKLPIISNLFEFSERKLLDSPLARFGGFLVVKAQKLG